MSLDTGGPGVGSGSSADALGDAFYPLFRRLFDAKGTGRVVESVCGGIQYGVLAYELLRSGDDVRAQVEGLLVSRVIWGELVCEVHHLGPGNSPR